MSAGRPESWRPAATNAALRRRAALLTRARSFFAARGVLEVETPILSTSGATDPQIDSLTTRVSGLPGDLYLSTSPEFPMKRLLASGIGDIYQLCKVFRDGEIGRWHNPEFTMLEWYRQGFDDAALMSEVDDLVRELLGPERPLEPAERLTYAESIRRYAGVDPDECSGNDLDRAAEAHGIACEATLDRDAKLDLLMALVVGPKLGAERPCFICDYPASQASLARLKPGSPRVAARFELYLDGVELANGFHELTDAREQRTRFLRDLATRRERLRHEPPMDEHLLSALAAGLPDCAGVAVGFDRLVALAQNSSYLSDAMAFSIENA
jgi:lysyl-tRNA synthetase class 2